MSDLTFMEVPTEEFTLPTLPGQFAQKGVLGETSFQITEMDWSEYEMLLMRSLTMQNGIAWWTGDLLNIAETLFGDRYKLAIPETDRARQTCANCKWVASKFAPNRRKHELSFGHHEAVASLTLEEQEAFLERAIVGENGKRWSVSHLRQQVRLTRPAAANVEAPDLFSVSVTPVLTPTETAKQAFLSDAGEVVFPATSPASETPQEATPIHFEQPWALPTEDDPDAEEQEEPVATAAPEMTRPDTSDLIKSAPTSASSVTETSVTDKPSSAAPETPSTGKAETTEEAETEPPTMVQCLLPNDEYDWLLDEGLTLGTAIASLRQLRDERAWTGTPIALPEPVLAIVEKFATAFNEDNSEGVLLESEMHFLSEIPKPITPSQLLSAMVRARAVRINWMQPSSPAPTLAPVSPETEAAVEEILAELKAEEKDNYANATLALASGEI